MGQRRMLDNRLGEIDQMIDDGQGSNDIMSERRNLVHQMIEKRSQKNVTGVVVDKDWVTDPKLDKEAFREYYANKFKPFSGIRPSNRSQRYKSLSNTQVDMLEKPFSNQEIHDAVWACGCDKAPGPDMFSFRFLRKFWDEFQTEIIAKLLTDRLVKVVDSIVSPEQSSFIKGRKIMDGALMAYDSLSWDYLDCMLEYMGFGDMWRKWIRGCLVSVRASVMIYTDRDNVECLIRILNIFYFASRLQLNLQKSKLYGICVAQNDVQDLARCTGCGADSVLFLYLGLPVGERMYQLHTRGLVPNSAIRRKIGNGTNTSFWKEIWCGDGTLEATFPRLVALVYNRNALVSDYWSTHGWNISWRRDIRGGVEQTQYDHLMACLQIIHINSDQDGWRWEFDNEETFTVRSIRKSLDVKRLPAVELWFRIGVWLELDIAEFVNVEDMFQWIDGQGGRKEDRCYIKKDASSHYHTIFKNELKKTRSTQSAT
ncbi:hypothetical protein Tco_0783964, partial [Tanacetum coccineum]